MCEFEQKSDIFYTECRFLCADFRNRCRDRTVESCKFEVLGSRDFISENQSSKNSDVDMPKLISYQFTQYNLPLSHDLRFPTM